MKFVLNLIINNGDVVLCHINKKTKKFSLLICPLNFLVRLKVIRFGETILLLSSNHSRTVCQMSHHKILLYIIFMRNNP